MILEGMTPGHRADHITSSTLRGARGGLAPMSLLRNCAVLTGLAFDFPLTRHSAFGCVPGYDCCVPAALDFAALVPPSSNRAELL
jgi:hypothetical protein